jgi:hypothetical protein
MEDIRIGLPKQLKTPHLHTEKLTVLRTREKTIV